MIINLLDLFSGVGGFSQGLTQAGFTINKHYTSEIDKHAKAIYKYKFPKSIDVGDVRHVRANQLERIDAITFGSPCQDFSLAGTRKGMSGDRSSLITEAIRLIDECTPKFFIWENVKGTFSSNNGADFWAIIQAFANLGNYRLEWQLLNTAWFLPQNRERIYLVGHLTTSKRSFGEVFPIGKDDKLSVRKKKSKERQSQAKNSTTITRVFGTNADSTFVKSKTIASCFTAGGNSGGMHSDMNTIEVGTMRTHVDGNGFRETKSGLCPTIPARSREDGSGQPCIKVKSATKCGYEEAKEGDSINLSVPNSVTRRGRVGKGKSQTLDTACNQAVVNDSLTKIRRLTEVECERLQGFPDNWTQYGIYEGEIKEISKSQRYKQLGNAVTKAVVEKIGKNLLLCT